MKILYAVQGTGNGHIVRAAELIPTFRAAPGVEVDVLVSGTQHELNLPFDVRFRKEGLSFVFGKSGGIDYWRTFKQMNLRRLLRDTCQLPVKNYDLVISDFEPISARAAQLRGVPCIGLSNQAAINHPLSPKPKRPDRASQWITKYYAPTDHSIGMHYNAYHSSIFTPLIRQSVRQLTPTREGHYCVYLPSYSNVNILRTLRHLPQWQWKVFSKTALTAKIYGNVEILPIDTDAFLSHLASCDGIICNAGFGVTAEALYLGKKMLVIPMKNQYEQQCNAAALAQMGVRVYDALHAGNSLAVIKWINSGQPVKVDYPDHKNAIVSAVLNQYSPLAPGTSIISEVSNVNVLWDESFQRQRI